MKHNLLYLAVFIILSCSEKKVSSITIISENERDKIDFFEVIRPVDDIIFWTKNKDTIFRNNNGILKFETNIEKPEIIKIIVDKKWFKLVLQPNKNYELTVTDSSKVFTGENAVGTNYYNQIQRPIFNSVFHNFIHDTKVEQVVTTVDSLKEIELKEINRLKNENAIDDQQFKIFKKDIDYTYADLLISLMAVKYNIGKPIPFKDAKALITKTSKKYPLTIENRPLYWTEHAENYYILINHFYSLNEGKYKIEELENYFIEDKLIPIEIEYIKAIPSIETKEKLWAFYIMRTTVAKNYEKNIIKVFNDFKETFPNSVYTPFLEPEIEIFKNYHKKINQQTSQNFTFIDGKNINSLSELIQKLKGDKYYVDVWATWCAPCKKEFKHNKKLDSLLKEYNYKKLYISIDKESLTQRWKDQIKYYDLTGTHILINAKFEKDFRENHSEIKDVMSIPQYLIIDNKGKIVSNHAPRPSAIDKLKKIL